LNHALAFWPFFPSRTLSALAHWSAIFSDTPYLPLLAFPFVKLFQNNQLICFEVVATLISKYFRNLDFFFLNRSRSIKESHLEQKVVRETFTRKCGELNFLDSIYCSGLGSVRKNSILYLLGVGCFSWDCCRIEHLASSACWPLSAVNACCQCLPFSVCCQCLLSVPAVNACCPMLAIQCLLSVPAVSACCQCLLSNACHSVPAVQCLPFSAC
jgi:hypothetical protein